MSSPPSVPDICLDSFEPPSFPAADFVTIELHFGEDLPKPSVLSELACNVSVPAGNLFACDLPESLAIVRDDRQGSLVLVDLTAVGFNPAGIILAFQV